MSLLTPHRSIVAALLGLVVMVGAYFPGQAQRRVTPVVAASQGIQGKNDNRERTDSIARSTLAHFHDENGNVILVDTVTGMEVKDTIALGTGQSIPKMIQPLLFSASVGVDIWDPVMRLFGQKYGLVEFSGELNLHNRYIPVVEVGLGRTNYTPDEGNYTYRVPLTPYFRIGANYNFIYNNNPDYMAYAGLRLGYSSYNWGLDNVTLGSPYWDEHFQGNLPRQHASLTYMQVLFGLRVKLWGPISAGWSMRIKARLHESKSPLGQPWYIPGYGTRKGAIAGSFSIFYTFQLNAVADWRSQADKAKKEKEKNKKKHKSDNR